jgi:hypothetical protein
MSRTGHGQESYDPNIEWNKPGVSNAPERGSFPESRQPKF